MSKSLILQKNLNLLEQIRKQSANEAAAIKRKMTVQTSCTISYDNQKSLIITTVTKKFKMNEDDATVFFARISKKMMK